MTLPLVTIIICTCNRAEDLRQTLASLEEVCVPAGLSCELVVVDNASTDHTAQVVQECRLPNMALRYVYEARRGKGFAYNRGMAEAKGQVFLFTDDDVRPPQDWIAGMAEPILSGRADAVAGGVKLAPHLEREWMRPALRRALAATEGFSESDTMVGANMAFSRSVLSKVPAFDPELGPGALGFFDETLFTDQLREAGYKVLARYEVAVEHHPAADRLTHANYLDTARKYGLSRGYLAHHWEHRRIRFVRLRILRHQAWLTWKRWTRHAEAVRPEGIADWEFNLVTHLNLYRQYLLESKRPRNYEKHGLTKLTHEHKP